MVSGNFKNKKKRAGGKEDLKIRKSKESLSQKLPLLYFSRKQRSANNKKHELNLTRSLELFLRETMLSNACQERNSRCTQKRLREI